MDAGRTHIGNRAQNGATWTAVLIVTMQKRLQLRASIAITGGARTKELVDMPNQTTNMVNAAEIRMELGSTESLRRPSKK